MGLCETVLFGKLHDRGPMLTEAEVAAFEHELAFPLPADYREFLLLCNGGRYYEYVACPLPTREYSHELRLVRLFQLLPTSDPDQNLRGLRRKLHMHEGRIPDDTLPIADSGADMLLIALEGQSRGALGLWVRDYELTRERADNFIPVAPSFTALASACATRPYYSELETEEPFIAAERFDLDGLRRCLDAGLNPDARNEEDMTLLVVACRELNYDAAELLLSRGADPNLPDLRWGYPPLHYAKGDGARDLVNLLLRYGAKKDVPPDS